LLLRYPFIMTESEVRKLLRLMKESDSQIAFRNFYNMTYDRLFRIAYYFTKREEWSKEIVLDVFMNLWNQRDTLLNVNNIEDYCFVLVKNASLNFLSKESKFANSSIDDTTESSDMDLSPEENLISEELFALYVKALDRLPERCREVFISLREEKKSYEQVASEMNISVKTVDAQLQKALSLLKKLLSDRLA
jgi:RNA polymerase sigma-70 factor (ECF subfamily)